MSASESKAIRRGASRMLALQSRRGASRMLALQSRRGASRMLALQSEILNFPRFRENRGGLVVFFGWNAAGCPGWRPESSAMSKLLNTAKDLDLIYDVGLHHGQDTDFYLKKGYRVIAFEADPANAEFCRSRFSNEISEGRLEIVEGAITEDFPSKGRAAAVKFYRNADHSLWGSTSEDWAVRNEALGTRNDIIRVRAINFVRCLEKYGIPYYLKADIVGSETICLRALLNFKNKPDYLSIRSEKFVWHKLQYEFDLLEKLGYDQFTAVKQDFETIRPQLPSLNGAKFHTFEEGASGPFGEEAPGTWKNREFVLKQYRRIFAKYWLFGDYSYLIQTAKGRQFIANLEGVFRRTVPGWYDTHARHSSVIDKA